MLLLLMEAALPEMGGNHFPVLPQKGVDIVDSPSVSHPLEIRLEILTDTVQSHCPTVLVLDTSESFTPINQRHD